MRDLLNRVAVQHDRPDTAQRPTWPWAVVSVALVVLILGTALVTHQLVLSSRRPTVVPAPSLPLMNAVAIAHPEAGAALVALDAGNGHLLALAAPRELTCPPTGACPSAPAPDAFVVLDGRSGESLASTSLSGDAASAAGARQLLIDGGHHLAYAVAPQAVSIFSTGDGARVGGYALPGELASGVSGVSGAIDGGSSGTGGLYLTNGRQVFLVQAGSGQVLARQDLAGGSAGSLLDGPILDGARARIYLLLRGAAMQDPPRLLALAAHSLLPLGQSALPAGARLGPIDAADANLYVLGFDGTTWRLPLDALASLLSQGGQGGQPTLTAVPALRNALALGENRTLGRQYVADVSRTREMGATGAVAALPLPARWTSSVPLPVDEGRGLVYLPTDHGAIVIVQDGAGAPAPGAATLSPSGAGILARAAFASVWHDAEPADGPPFASVAMFPVQPGTRSQDLWLRDPARGWLGPYAGQAATAIAASPQAGTWRVTFSLSWYILFAHQHSWAWDVSTDGVAHLVAETGDSVP